MTTSDFRPRSGYTLPVFACASAIAALRWLAEDLSALPSVAVDLLNPPETVEIPIEQVARLSSSSALAITRSDPGDNLDLTRHTPIWAVVEWAVAETQNGGLNDIQLQGGEGVGRLVNAADHPAVDHPAVDHPAIYAYAQRLITENLRRWLPAGRRIQVSIILPEGRSLAERTSNAAFGVVEGLSLLGTSGIAQPLSAPGQLELYRQELRQRRDWYDGLVFCVGENGLDLAQRLGISPDRLLKTANWLGSMLVEAGLQGVESILLFGYHGKLIKLAGGIFHTHHHVADGRQEILAAHCAKLGLPTSDIQKILTSPTAEAALGHLRTLDAKIDGNWVEQIYNSIAQQIDQRAQGYIQIHSDRSVRVGSVLFDRHRQIVIQSEIATQMLSQIC
ncbi:cobalt-precorrin-5B (C(1))-methyltransferase CbiD [Egbenema bharatensis]|uniref:cobalt-precorrin-5B (C(1))-methyltransferase CbiD n=1 Tax=Egbenema bharatensis TaxID=3463334 RepID=UPI003A85A68C